MAADKAVISQDSRPSQGPCRRANRYSPHRLLPAQPLRGGSSQSKYLPTGAAARTRRDARDNEIPLGAGFSLRLIQYKIKPMAAFWSCYCQTSIAYVVGHNPTLFYFSGPPTE
jgi:hypothetical protein